MQVKLIDNTHAQIVDLPNVQLIFSEKSDQRIESLVLGMQLRDSPPKNEGGGDSEARFVPVQSIHDRAGRS